MVTDREPWSEDTAAWLREAAAAGLPMFGVCCNHQLLAHALGGKVGYTPPAASWAPRPWSCCRRRPATSCWTACPPASRPRCYMRRPCCNRRRARPCWPGPTRIRTRCSASARTCSRPSSTPNSARTSCAPTWNATSASTWRKTWTCPAWPPMCAPRRSPAGCCAASWISAPRRQPSAISGVRGGRAWHHFSSAQSRAPSPTP